jgi:hypothetical protein
VFHVEQFGLIVLALAPDCSTWNIPTYLDSARLFYVEHFWARRPRMFHVEHRAEMAWLGGAPPQG